MAESSKTQSTATGVSSKAVDWASLKPKSIGHEDAMSAANVKERWGKMFSLAGLRSPNEATQNAFKLAVYVYCAVNGTSREGNYSSKITMADGHTFDAAVIPRAVGKSEVRRFMRGDMINAYEALKASSAVEEDERYVARVGKHGVLPQQAFATADFFQDCPLFTPLEQNAYELSRNYGLVRAAKGRGGTLESVEKGRVDEGLDAQGAGNEASTRMDGRAIF